MTHGRAYLVFMNDSVSKGSSILTSVHILTLTPLESSTISHLNNSGILSMP